MIVVKLGGSLYNTPELKLWLKTLTIQAKSHPIIIVPGGGPFADQVRHAQETHQFSDSHAHHMALLAMSQFGLLLSSLVPNCQVLNFPEDPITTFEGLSVWLPNQQLLTKTALKHSWDISSDSLALWLANELHAEQLILIKQVDLPNNLSISKLSEQGILDRGFPQLYAQIPVPSQIIYVQNYQQFSAQLDPNSLSRLQLQ
ncbi:MAG: delta 1-pyrroline-5-carboxylate synthetase [Piscirickettsiaceae bacterium]|nr:delta 1-pyrroline-5-carboxylate synthetase [Piscirickettsiaceae bacterium]